VLDDYKLEAQKLIKEGRLSKEDAILAIKILEHNQKIGKNYTLQKILTTKKLLKPLKNESSPLEQEKKPDTFDISSWELEEITPNKKSNVANQGSTDKTNNKTSTDKKTDLPVKKNIVTKPIVSTPTITTNENVEYSTLDLEEIKQVEKFVKVEPSNDHIEPLDLMEEEPSKFNRIVSKLNWKIAP
jgi:hypothetical protein